MSPTATTEAIERTAPLFAALSDPTRLQLMDQLSNNGPQSISALAESATISRQAVTKHLLALEETGLAESYREGRVRIFELRPEQLDAAHRFLDQIAHQWDETLERLQTYVEEEKGE